MNGRKKNQILITKMRISILIKQEIFQLKYYFRYGPSKQDYYAQISQMKVNDLHPIGFGQ